MVLQFTEVWNYFKGLPMIEFWQNVLCIWYNICMHFLSFDPSRDWVVVVKNT